jgi:hypothetical protein
LKDCGVHRPGGLHLEPLIPFAGSHLKQSTLLEVQAGGRLSFWEGFMKTCIELCREQALNVLADNVAIARVVSESGPEFQRARVTVLLVRREQRSKTAPQLRKPQIKSGRRQKGQPLPVLKPLDTPN